MKSSGNLVANVGNVCSVLFGDKVKFKQSQSQTGVASAGMCNSSRCNYSRNRVSSDLSIPVTSRQIACQHLQPQLHLYVNLMNLQPHLYLQQVQTLTC